ncbi:zinc finger protein 768 isoform X7 [Hyalella azteca]|uniref:Zinc finger protein 768 isoform X7 n=1 Tax=Hyalella azteca TaxID=294128 RepID=A0A8B7P7X0_HYAAZ|nr:zinc finger protein 768 isoform X7 [Hyalella azteca]
MVQSVKLPTFCSRSMPDEILSLKWNKHNSTFLEVLSILRDQEAFVDVTLACGGKIFPAHKFILSTCSDYFKQMFAVNPDKHPIVYLKDVPATDLEALLDFMYRGEVDVSRTNLASLMNTAEGLQVKGLAIPDGSHLLRRETLSTPTPPRPPPEPSISPPPKRKRYHENYLPISALNMFYNNIHSSAPETNSPYDLSQKNSSSSSVSQSDIPCSDRSSSPSPSEHKPSVTQVLLAAQRSSPSQDPHLSSQSCRAPTPSPGYHSKENSMEDESGTVASSSPRTPLPSSSSGEGNSSKDSRDDRPVVPGPSGVQSSGNNNHSDDDVVVKEDVSVDDYDYCDDYSTGNCGDSGGGSDGGTGDLAPTDSIPPPSECSESSLPPSFDPALGQALQHSLPFPHAEQLTNLTCPICTKEFKVLGSLKRHYRSHINFKPYECEICYKRFTLNQYLIEHRRTHTGEKPYSCHVCGKSFAQTGTLYHHVRNVHQISWTEKPN